MMEILSPEKIQNDREAVVAERQKRAHEAAREEAEILQRLNDARDEESRAQAEKDLQTLPKVSELEARLFALQEEVPALESRKAEALLPIIDRENAVAEREQAVTEKEMELGTRSRELDQREETLTDRAERLQDAEDEFTDRSLTLREREVACEKAENALKASTENFNEKLLEFHQAVNNQNEFLANKEAENDAKYKANATREEELRLKEFDLENRERALTDKYVTFQMSAEQWQKDHPDAPLLENSEA